MAVANYAGRQEQSLREQARQETDPDKRRELNAQADRWAEGIDGDSSHSVLLALRQIYHSNRICSFAACLPVSLGRKPFAVRAESNLRLFI
jgi:hypothetical protein